MIPGGVAPQPSLKEAAIPGMASQIFFVYSRSPSSCLYQVTAFLFISMVDPIHTSGLVEASASMVYRPLSSGCGGVSVIGAWPNAVLVAGGSLAVWSPQCPTPWVAWIDGRGRQLLEGQRLSAAACLGERRGAATGRRSQASLYQLPQPLYGD